MVLLGSTIKDYYIQVHFIPRRTDAVFRKWALKGLEKIQDLYRLYLRQVVFEEISHTYDIDRKYFFKFLQISNYIGTRL